MYIVFGYTYRMYTQAHTYRDDIYNKIIKISMRIIYKNFEIVVRKEKGMNEGWGFSFFFNVLIF